tara:strand:- start:83 stop:241 length:159 start_codon:yes stop_codon:yes gene_type:complete
VEDLERAGDVFLTVAETGGLRVAVIAGDARFIATEATVRAAADDAPLIDHAV